MLLDDFSWHGLRCAFLVVFGSIFSAHLVGFLNLRASSFSILEAGVMSAFPIESVDSGCMSLLIVVHPSGHVYHKNQHLLVIPNRLPLLIAAILCRPE